MLLLGTQRRQQAIRRREIRNNRARLLPPRELQVHMATCCCCCSCSCSVAAAVTTLEIRDSQDRRNIAGRKPRRRGVLDNAAPFPGVGTTALTRPAFAEQETQRGRTGD